jgi:hypothetical protein
VSSLDHHEFEREVVEYAIKAIANLGVGEANKQKCVAAGAPVKIVRALQDFPSDPEITLAAAIAITNFCTHSPGGRQACMDAAAAQHLANSKVNLRGKAGVCVAIEKAEHALNTEPPKPCCQIS